MLECIFKTGLYATLHVHEVYKNIAHNMVLGKESQAVSVFLLFLKKYMSVQNH